MEETQYTVKQGDTLNQIANKYGFNNYKDAGITGYSSGNPDLIRPGEVLTLKGKTVTTPTVVSSEVGKNKVNNMVSELNNQSNTTRVGQNTFTTSLNFGSLDDDIKSVTDNINNIQAGNYNMTQDEQLMLEGVRQTYAKARAFQEDLNKRQFGGQQIVESRTGRSRYAPEIAQANINKRIQDGLDKVAEINLEEQINLAKMRQDITDRKLKQAGDNYDRMLDLRKERRDEIMDMNRFMLDITREQRQQMNDTLDRQLTEIKLADEKKARGLDVLTMDDARRYDLPESIVNKTKADIIKDLTVSNPPQWFIESQLKISNDPNYTGEPRTGSKEEWDIFRNMDDVQVLIGSMEQAGSSGGDLYQ